MKKNTLIFLIILMAVALQKAVSHDVEVQRPGVLILSSTIGGGHKAASESAKNAILNADSKAEVVIKNAEDFSSPLKNKSRSTIYWTAVKNSPDLVTKAYEDLMRKGNQSLDQIAHYVNVKHLVTYIEEKGFTHVIVAHELTAASLAFARLNGMLQSQKIAFILTDMLVDVFPKVAKQLDMTFLPHPALQNAYLNAGVLDSQLAVTGMPVSSTVKDPIDREGFLLERKLNPNLYTITLASGSEGIGNFPKIVESIVSFVKEKPIQIIAVCGKNEEHSKALKRVVERYNAQGVFLRVLFHKNYDAATCRYQISLTPQDELFGFIKSSDLYITKSGGLSPCEAAAIGVPMILLDVYGGHEERNAKFYESQNIALICKDESQIGKLVIRIQESTALREMMRCQQKEFASISDLRPIVDFIYPIHLKE